MKEFIWNLRCMLSAKKYAKENDQCRNQYEWYKYLLNISIESFFNKLKFWNRSDELPF